MHATPWKSSFWQLYQTDSLFLSDFIKMIIFNWVGRPPTIIVWVIVWTFVFFGVRLFKQFIDILDDRTRGDFFCLLLLLFENDQISPLSLSLYPFFRIWIPTMTSDRKKKKKKKSGSFRWDRCFVKYTKQTNVFNLMKECIYFMSVADGHLRERESKRQKNDFSFFVMLNHRHVHRLTKKITWETHSHIELFIQRIKCRHRWSGGELLDSLYVQFFSLSLSFARARCSFVHSFVRFLSSLEKITFELLCSRSQGFSPFIFASMGTTERKRPKQNNIVSLSFEQNKGQTGNIYLYKKVNFTFFLFQGTY